ncbi:MAG TPA: hypothetical protein VK843_06725 [Planctomycetota bacterium]|nr:hypothetical protein [Planctomycetota bacterium]
MPQPASISTRVHELCQGTPGCAESWIRRRGALAIAEPVGLILVCGACYGASIGAWRAGELALYCALKLPLLFLATAAVNALLNGLWARRLGLELSLAESFRAVLLSFALAALVLAAFAPVILFFDRTLPCPTSRDAWSSHDLLGRVHVCAIALAGSVAVLRQRQWLAEHCPKAVHTQRVTWLWLAINLIVGAQISWNLRPWFGTPRMKVEFLREDPFDGTFYESVFQMTRRATR